MRSNKFLRFSLVIAALGVSTAVVMLVKNQTSEDVAEEQLTAYESYALETIKRKSEGKSPKADQPDMHAAIERELRTREGFSAPEYGDNQVMEEFLKAKRRSQRARGANDEFNFIERGPGNVAGRTRALLIDPDDASGQTWLAGSASGGIWKTTDGGSNWTFISDDIPNLGTNTLAMSKANPSVIYAGTGEHFTRDVDGAGLFKSTDKGQTWSQVASPDEFPDFKNVSRIAVNPDDENVVIATTRNSVWGSGLSAAIYKTTDGGASWTALRTSTSERYDDIAVDPTDFDKIYVAMDAQGVIKSTDGGVTWSDASNGMSPGGRVEIDISTVNTDRLWASVEGGASGSGSDLYVTSDGAETWNLVINEAGANEDFLGGQGWYDNIMLAHPFDADIAYAAGVNIFKFSLASGTAIPINLLDASQTTDSFMDFINFGGGLLGGAIDVSGDIADEDLLSVEIRFGQGTQKAHRFTVGGQGSGVPDASYVYEDYVDVPFQVWDTENNVQLMASFRDQQEDGAWNLIESNTDSGDGSTHSREYLFVHNQAYSESANADIAQDGGVAAGQLYFLWSVLRAGATFDPDNLPESAVTISVEEVQAFPRTTTVVSDAYNDFTGVNSFPQSGRDQGIHPDQHGGFIADIDEANQTFRLMITNDGGVYESVSSADPGPTDGDFNYTSFGYNTTQFYGADKAPGENRFIGGTQDNGTWYHPSGTEGAADTDAVFGIGGDGFEALWHSENVNMMIGGSQFNGLARTTNGGETWIGASSGLAGNGPFRTRLSHNKSLPDRLFAVTSNGVFKSNDFGGSWSASSMSDASGWSAAFTNSTDVEVSTANPDIVWAGARLSSTGRLHVSIDGGGTFNPVENYDVFNMGSVSGIGTHPSENNIAYALFSFAGLPKVLITEDLGQTWTDISGFDDTGDRGFPDVAVNAIFVFPNDNNRIWVGSEIGIIESLDAGASWGLLSSNFPAVNVHDFKLSGDVLTIATYGRGIWSVKIPDLPSAPSLQSSNVTIDKSTVINITHTDEFDSTEIYIDGTYITTEYENAIGSSTVSFNNSEFNGEFDIRFVSYKNGDRFISTGTLFTFVVNDVANTLGTDFTDNSDDDFVGLNMEVLLSSGGFSEGGIHTRHPYLPGQDEIMHLRTPIRVAGTNATISYKDVAIVSMGASGSSFGDVDFSDYVVVEGSADGSTWVPLKGYDASLHDEWTAALSPSNPINVSLLKRQEINLLDTFNEGDEILIRFRLFADPGNQSGNFGWVIDDLYIQQEVPLSVDSDQLVNIQVFPNPVQNELKINAKGFQNATMYNLQGKVIDQFTLTNGQATWIKKNAPKGTYILELSGENGQVSRKLFLE